MQIITRMVEVLDIVSSKESGVRLVDFTKECNISKTALFRITHSLCKQGVLYKDGTDRYYLGPRFFYWMGKYKNSPVLVQIARPFLEELHKATKETIHLFHYRGGEAVYIDKIESIHPLTIRSRVGTSQPLYCTAGGKAILGSLPADDLDSYLSNNLLEMRTKNTLSTPTKLKESLKHAREKRFFEEVEENEMGIRCIAAPIVDERGLPIGSMSITMPVYRAPSEDVIVKWNNLLWEKVQKIETKLLQRGLEDGTN